MYYKKKIQISLIIFSLILFSCQKNENDIISKTNIVKDTLNTNELEKIITSTKTTQLVDKKLFLDFYVGQPFDSVLELQKKYIKEGRIYYKNVYWEKQQHLFINIPLEITNVTTLKKAILKTDIRFNFDNGKLSSMMLVLFSEKNLVPNELKKNQKEVTLKELEDNLLNKSNSMDLDSEMEKQKSSIETISFLHVKGIYEDLKQLYVTKYGNPIYLKNELRVKNPYGDILDDKNDPLNLLWLVDGKYIKFNFTGLYSVSLEYYNSNNKSRKEDILIGSIFYSTIENEKESYKNYKRKNLIESNNKIDSSVINEKKRIEETGI